jgi:Family of unknown function (DUF6308)
MPWGPFMAEPAELFRVTLRHGSDVDGLATALAFIEAYPRTMADAGAPDSSFGEEDLRRANRGGARISAAEIADVLERRDGIERRLREIEPTASLAARSVPWNALTQLFGAFSDIRGFGFSKLTKTLHPKRPALIPMLDSFVQAYLQGNDPGGSFAERATALVRGYKVDLDRNRAALRATRRELAARGYDLTEVRILDILIWCRGAQPGLGSRR